MNHINKLRPRQNGRYFPDEIFKCIFVNENAWISITFSLKFVHKCPINNIPTLVQIMAWRRPGDKPLSEPMLVRSPTQNYVLMSCYILQIFDVSRSCITRLYTHDNSYSDITSARLSRNRQRNMTAIYVESALTAYPILSLFWKWAYRVRHPW